MDCLQEQEGHLQTIHELTGRLKSQEAIRRQAQKDLLKLREDIASSNSLSAHRSCDLETASLAKVSLCFISPPHMVLFACAPTVCRPPPPPLAHTHSMAACHAA